jgi:hypothetical protein
MEITEGDRWRSPFPLFPPAQRIFSSFYACA